MVYRGMRLKKELEARGDKVIKVYPYASKIHLFGKGIPPKRKLEGLIFLRQHLSRLLPNLSSPVNEFNHDMCDAAIAAYTAYLHSKGRTEAVGDPSEGVIYVPVLLHRG